MEKILHIYMSNGMSHNNFFYYLILHIINADVFKFYRFNYFIKILIQGVYFSEP